MKATPPAMPRCKPFSASALLLLLFSLIPTPAADWPTYRADYSRSGISPERLALPLNLTWTFQSQHPPQPAWGGEAKWDGYNKVYDMKHRQDFDKAFHVVAVGERLFFGSSADDKVYCLNANTGAEQWTFYTEGPVRLAPTLHQERVYVGSDDGYAYCLSADSGRLIWKTRLGPRDYRIPGNGRIISAWPLRASVIATDDNIYTCAGMFPSEGVYLCALDPATGRVKWTQTLSDLPAQGYMLASATRLYVPTGRNNPIIFNRADGKRLQTTPGSGGTYALLAGSTLVFGPGKTGQLGVVGEGQSDQLATFAGNHLIVSPDMSYLHSDKEISGLDRQRYIHLAQAKRRLEAQRNAATKTLKSTDANSAEAKRLQDQLTTLGQSIDQTATDMAACIPWRQPCSHPYCLILAGTELWAGGDNEIAAYSTVNGKILWQTPVNGKALGLAVANRKLYVSTDQGTIHCLQASP